MGAIGWLDVWTAFFLAATPWAGVWTSLVLWLRDRLAERDRASADRAAQVYRRLARVEALITGLLAALQIKVRLSEDGQVPPGLSGAQPETPPPAE